MTETNVALRHDGWRGERARPRVGCEVSCAGWPAFVSFSIVLLLCYLPVLVTPYAFFDDYLLLATGLRGEMAVERATKIAQGRPLHALLVNIFFRQGDVGSLCYLRLLGVAGIILLAWSLYRALQRVGWGAPLSFALAVIICTLPPFQLYAAWAVTAFFPFAALASGKALALAERALHERRPKRKWGLVVAAVLALLFALTIFQPAAMFFWVFAAVVLFRPGRSTRDVFLHFLWFSAIASAGLLLGFVVYKLGAWAYPSFLSPDRSHLVQNVGEKMFWFLRAPLMNALNLFQLFPKYGLAWKVAVFLFCGMLLYWRGGIKERLVRLSLALFLLPLSYIPNLIIEESWPSYRSQFALTALVAVYAFYALWGYGRLLFRSFAVTASTVMLSFLALGSSLLAAYNVNAYFASPQRKELAVMRVRLAQQDLSAVRSLYIVGAHWQDSIAPGVRYDEFGLPSSCQPWSAKAMAYLLLREIDPRRADIPTEFTPSEGPLDPPAGALVVNMHEMLSRR